jgi:hypothetical protein
VTATAVMAFPDQEVLNRLASATASGRLRMPVARTYRLDEGSQAIADFIQGTMGKLGVSLPDRPQHELARCGDETFAERAEGSDLNRDLRVWAEAWISPLDCLDSITIRPRFQRERADRNDGRLCGYPETCRHSVYLCVDHIGRVRHDDQFLCPDER